MDPIAKASTFLLWYKSPSQFFKDIFKFEPYEYQKKILESIQSGSKRIIIQAAASTGKTRLLAVIALWLSIVVSKIEKDPIRVIIISGSRSQAKYLYDYCREALDHEYIQDEIEGEPLQSITKFKNGSEIRALPNSLKAIQGIHAEVVLIDEAVLAGDFLIQDALRITSGMKRDIIILSGTPMDAASLFVNIFQDTTEYPDWKRFNWKASDCPRIPVEKLKEAESLPEEVRQVFWEGKPYLLKSERVVEFDALKDCVKDVEQFLPDGNNRIVAGLDWGFEHYTAIVILQKVNDIYRVLYCDQWRREQFEDIHQKILEICRHFNVETVYADAENAGENQRLEAKGIAVEPVPFQYKKTQMQSHMRLLFHQRKVKIPQIYQDLIQELRMYNWNSKSGDDLVDALQLGLYNYEKEHGEVWWKVI